MANATRKKLFVLSLWYFPSHFGLHVDDVAEAFSEAGYDVTIVTVERDTFGLPYFDPFRDTFEGDVTDRRNVVRLAVERFDDRAAYNPHVWFRRDAAFLDLKHRMETAPCVLLHYFEMLLPAFNRETITSARSCSLMYAGNFLRRIASGEAAGDIDAPGADSIARKLLDRVRIDRADGSYTLRGTDCMLSETRELPRMLAATRLATPVCWVSRPILKAPVITAPLVGIRREFDIPEDAKVLFYPGRPAKNAKILPTILELVQHHKPGQRFVLLLVGSRPDDVASWPGYEAAQAQIRAIPMVRREKLFGIMKAVDVLTYPGLIDGYPKVVSEAGLVRLPVVAFDSPASGLREMGKSGEIALLVDATSPRRTSAMENAAFAAAIGRILSDRALRDALVDRAFCAATRMDAQHFVARVERAWRTGSCDINRPS